MIYFKTEKDGYIASVGTAEESVGIEISKAEYDEILTIKQNKPTAPEGYGYRLKADLTWELVELPPMPEDDELTAEEALDRIFGEVSV